MTEQEHKYQQQQSRSEGAWGHRASLPQCSACTHAHPEHSQATVHSSRGSLFAFREQFLSTPTASTTAFFKALKAHSSHGCPQILEA